MNKATLEMAVETMEKLGWSVRVTEDGTVFKFELQQYSPAGQDFNVYVEAACLYDLQDELNERYENYDVSYETYLWLDDTGHGENGAPYDMIDVYNDMKECEGMLGELYEAIDELEDIED